MRNVICLRAFGSGRIGYETLTSFNFVRWNYLDRLYSEMCRRNALYRYYDRDWSTSGRA